MLTHAVLLKFEGTFLRSLACMLEIVIALLLQAACVDGQVTFAEQMTLISARVHLKTVCNIQGRWETGQSGVVHPSYVKERSRVQLGREA